VPSRRKRRQPDAWQPSRRCSGACCALERPRYRAAGAGQAARTHAWRLLAYCTAAALLRRSARQGNVAEAQALFQQELEARPAGGPAGGSTRAPEQDGTWEDGHPGARRAREANPPPPSHRQRVTRSCRAAAGGDWEDLDARLDRLVLEPSPAAAAAARRAHRTPPARPRQPPPAPAAAAPRSNGRAGTPPPAERGLVFDGAHVLEAHGLTSATTTTELEAWLESLDLRPLGPVVRRALGASLMRTAAAGISQQAVEGLRAHPGLHERPGVCPPAPLPGLPSLRGPQVGGRRLRAGGVCDARRRARGARARARVRVPLAQLCAGAPCPAGLLAGGTRCHTVGWHCRAERV